MPHALFWNTIVAQCRSALEHEIECKDGTVASQLQYLRHLHAQTIEDHLTKRGTQVSSRSFTMLLFAVNRAILQAGEVVVRQARGDYAPGAALLRQHDRTRRHGRHALGYRGAPAQVAGQATGVRA